MRNGLLALWVDEGKRLPEFRHKPVLSQTGSVSHVFRSRGRPESR